MTRFLSTLLFSIALISHVSGQVGINTTMADPSAALDITATNKGLLIPRVALASAIPSPAAGLMVHQTTAPAGLYYHNGTGWTMISGPDNLGNHTATTDLSMATKDIKAVDSLYTNNAKIGPNNMPITGGTNGQVLTTNGAGTLSWGSSSGGGATLQLSVTKTVTQTLAIGTSASTAPLPALITFESANTGTLTGGNTWATNNTFTATTAGLYMIDVQLISNNIQTSSSAPIVMIDMNNSGLSGSSFYGFGLAHNTQVQLPHQGRSQLQKIIFMTAAEFFTIRAASSSTANSAILSSNGSCNLRVYKMN